MCSTTPPGPLWPELFDLFLDERAEALSIETIMDRLGATIADVFRLVVQMDHELTEDDGIVRYTDDSLLAYVMSFSPEEAFKWSADAPVGSVWHESLAGAAEASDNPC